MSFQKIVFVIAFLGIFAGGFFVNAQPAQAATIEELQALIAQLQVQIAALQSQLAQLKQNSPSPSAFTFQKDLQITDRNEEVKELQKTLKSEGLFCARCLITGYFGYWTKAGLMNFQQKYGLPITGITDTTTRAKLNQFTPKDTVVSPLSSTPPQTLTLTPTPAPTPTRTPIPTPQPVSSSTTVLPSNGDAEQFKKANSLYNKKLPDLSSSDASIRDPAINNIKAEYQKIIDEYPTSELRDDAQFLIAQLVARSKSAPLARAEYQKVVDNYPASYLNTESLQWIGWSPYVSCSQQIDIQIMLSTPTVALAQFHIASIYSDLNQFPDYIDYDRSVLEFQKIVDKYTKTRIATDAQWYIGEAYNSMHKRREGITAFRKLIDNYPKETVRVGQAYERIGAMLSALSDYNELDTYAAELAFKYSSKNFIVESSFLELDCKPPKWNKTTLTVGIDETKITLAQKNIVLSALQKWSDSTNDLIKFQIIQGGTKRETLGGLGVDIYIEFPQYIWFGGAGATTRAVSDIGIWRAVISLPGNTNDENLRKISLHEIGHTLGVGHSFNRNDIMTNIGTTTKDYTGNGELTQRDLNTLVAIYK